VKLALRHSLRRLLARLIPHRAVAVRCERYRTYRADGCDYIIPTPDPVAGNPKKAKP